MKMLTIIISILFCICILLIGEALIAMIGKKEPFENPDRKEVILGENGKVLKYIVMGDSIGAGQGADYQKSVALQTAKYLSQNNKVSLVNLSVSGATVKSVKNDQLKKAVELRPDILLLSVGANDVTHLTRAKSLSKDLNTILSELKKSNCNMKIILTASPDMGSPPRLPQPLRYLAGIRTFQLNTSFYRIIKEQNLTLAPIAIKTGELFRNDATLFSEDKFHPNEKGYAIWTSVINAALDDSLKNQQTHCES